MALPIIALDKSAKAGGNVSPYTDGRKCLICNLPYLRKGQSSVYTIFPIKFENSTVQEELFLSMLLKARQGNDNKRHLPTVIPALSKFFEAVGTGTHTVGEQIDAFCANFIKVKLGNSSVENSAKAFATADGTVIAEAVVHRHPYEGTEFISLEITKLRKATADDTFVVPSV